MYLIHLSIHSFIQTQTDRKIGHNTIHSLNLHIFIFSSSLFSFMCDFIINIFFAIFICFKIDGFDGRQNQTSNQNGNFVIHNRILHYRMGFTFIIIKFYITFFLSISFHCVPMHFAYE